MTAHHSITDLAKEFDVTPRTLRFYEEKGLLNPDRNGQQRLYTAADRTRLRLILRGRKLGFTLDESADIIGMYDPGADNQPQLEALVNKIRESRSRLEQQRHDLDQMIEDLEAWEERTMASISEVKSRNTRTRAKR